MRRVLKRLVTPPLVVLAVVVVLFEEYLWRWLARVGAWLGALPVVRGVERRVAELPPAAALAVLLTPASLAIPVKLAAVWMLASGHAVLGLEVLISAKVVGTALVARIYTLCEPALSTIPWFVRLRGRVIAAKDWAHRKLEATAAWRIGRRKLAALRRAPRGFLADRWRGIRRWLTLHRA
ncbi:MAG: hypothetical protein M0006_08450 [Magnetospirillum sp.]|nr:hypothetical protein [Magnetospirillum sp.]